MKRMKHVTLLVLSVMVLVACGGNSAEAPAEPTTDPNLLPTPTLEPALEGTLPPPVMEESTGSEGEAAMPEAEESEPAVEELPEEAAPVVDLTTPWSAEDFGYGTQVHGNATVGDPVQIMNDAKNGLGMEWVKAQIQWWLVKPEPTADQWFFYDAVVDEAHNAGLRVMLSVVGAPEWTRAAGGENGPPDDYNEYAKFLTELLQRYDGKVHAIEVWNEQNLDREWTTANGVSPEDYVRFLEVAHTAIKAQDPNVIVISGALSPTGGGDGISWLDDFAWLDRALAAGLLDYADCVGVHHNGYNIPPDVAFDQTGTLPEAQTAVFRGPFDNPHHSWSFKTTVDTYAEKVQAVDPNKKLCVTEFGWASSEGYDAYPTGFEFAQDNTLEEQATYITQAYQQMYNSGDVWLAFLFNYDFGNKGSGVTDDPVPYSIIDINGVPRPAYGAVSGMEKPR